MLPIWMFEQSSPADAADELYSIYSTLIEISSPLKRPMISQVFETVEEAVEAARRAFCGSWLGYHSRVYYANLDTPPAGANFSSEWGFNDSYRTQYTTGDWREYQHDDLKRLIFTNADNPDLSDIENLSERASDSFDSAKAEILSILQSDQKLKKDSIVQKAIPEIEGTVEFSPSDIVTAMQPTGKFMTRDSLAATQGTQTPPHVEVAATMVSLRSPFIAAETLAKECKKLASHIQRISRSSHRQKDAGNRIFIGHGQSPLWRELKDFIHNRLSLEWDEFNRIPVAGTTNIARLSDMLSSASFALVVLTGEDELSDGATQARMNVIHEAGLFQGRLGFNKAIVLLEDGCKEFSNIEGLSQLRFPKNKISAIFEDVRAVLEREKLI